VKPENESYLGDLFIQKQKEIYVI